MQTFKDLPIGAIFQVKPSQGCTAYGKWVKAKATKMTNAYRPDNVKHRAWIGYDLKVIVEEA